MSRSTVMPLSVSHLDELAADPAVMAASEWLKPLRLRLSAAARNPDPAMRDRIDTWGDATELVVGVPEGAGPPEVVEALWLARLLAEGWPEPAAAMGWTGELRLGLLTAGARARARHSGIAPEELVSEPFLEFCLGLGTAADPRSIIQAWFLLVPLSEAGRAQGLDRIGHLDPELAEEADTLLGLLPSAPTSAEQARDLLDALVATGIR